MRKLCMWLGLLLWLQAGPLEAASFQVLGDLPGGDFESRALGVSSDGSVVVGESSSTSGLEAFRWTSEGGMIGLGLLPGRSWSSARAASADGSVVVGKSAPEAFRWTAAEGMVALGFPGTAARGVSADGSVVVGTSTTGAWRWTAGDGMIPLGYLPGDNGSEAEGVSADGSVVVGVSSYRDYIGTGRDEAFRWTLEDGMVGLGFISGDHADSMATAVSGDGSIVVGWSTSLVGGEQAFRLTADGGMVGLGFLPGDGLSRANSISADGSTVVGWSYGSADGRKPFIWDETHGLRNLKTLLAIDCGLQDELTGWSWMNATGVSNDGRVIVGSGFRRRIEEAWIAVIPEPCALALLTTGILGALACLWQRGIRQTLPRVNLNGLHKST